MSFLLKTANIALAFLWLFTGLTSLFFSPELGYQILEKTGINGEVATFFVYGGAFLDIGIGVWILSTWRIRLCCFTQITTIVTYSLLLSIIDASFWLHPFGPLTKNIPIIILILIILVHDKPNQLKL